MECAFDIESRLRPQPDRKSFATFQLYQGHIRLAFFGEQNFLNLPFWKGALKEIEDCGFASLILDLTGVDCLDCSIAGILVGLHRSLRKQGGRLVCIMPRDPVTRKVFVQNHLHFLLDFADTLQDAVIRLASLERKRSDSRQQATADRHEEMPGCACQ